PPQEQQKCFAIPHEHNTLYLTIHLFWIALLFTVLFHMSGPITPSRACKTQNSPENAARERSRVRNLRQAFHSLQAALPSVPPDTKLSKLDVLVLATNYIAHLTETLDQGGMLGDHTILQRAEYLHPVKKWPMRSLLYCGNIGERLTGAQLNQEALCPGESRLKD
uniref:Transcription factor 23 n=1 Tax=Sinocyclocheilus grahami TaxID=75366 RepID=A0A672T052_SINGR